MCIWHKSKISDYLQERGWAFFRESSMKTCFTIRWYSPLFCTRINKTKVYIKRLFFGFVISKNQCSIFYNKKQEESCSESLFHTIVMWREYLQHVYYTKNLHFAKKLYNPPVQLHVKSGSSLVLDFSVKKKKSERLDQIYSFTFFYAHKTQ